MAGKKLIWSARAKHNLNDIVQLYRAHNESVEYSYWLLQDFRRATERVEKNELRGQRFEDADLRFVVVLRNYQMVYRIGKEQNSIVAVWDARRNPNEL